MVAGWLVFMAYAHPGYMTYDSSQQLQEARTGVFGDWHPPVMALIWRWVDAIHSGPLGMLVLQSVSFLVGAFLLFRRYLAVVAAAVAATALLLFPPVGTTLAVIWKDSQMLAFLMLGTALLVGDNRRAQFAGLAVLVLATAMRHNAFSITFALIVLLFRWGGVHRTLVRYAIAVAMWLVVTSASFLLDRALTDKQTHPWHSSLAMFDIVGTLRYAPDLPDTETAPMLAGTPLQVQGDLQRKAKAVYDPFAGVFEIMASGYMRQPTNAQERHAVARAWRTLVTHYPTAYLRHRLRAFRELLQLTHRDKQWVWAGFDRWSGVQHSPGAVQRWLVDIGQRSGRTWLMRPYFYLLLLLVLLPFCFRAQSSLPLALSLSAIGSELALFFLSPTPDFRYSIWLTTSAFVVPILLVAIRYRRASPALR